jgi:hypothetical protein
LLIQISKDAIKVFKQALDKQRPNTLFTYDSFAYDEAYNKVFNSRVKTLKVEWVRRVGIKARETNNIIERKHGTLKDRLRPARGLKHDDTAKTWLDGYIVNYAFVKPHFSSVHFSINSHPPNAIPLYTVLLYIEIMSLKSKIINAITTHPKLVTFGIGLAITFAIGTAIGTLDHGQMAFAEGNNALGQQNK